MYYFYLDDLQLPFAPPELNISVGSQNDTVTLINGGEINILKSPALTEVSFEMRIPQMQYPFSVKLQPVSTYTDKLNDLKQNLKPFQFIVARMSDDGKLLFDTNLTMAVEEYSLVESADEGLDVLIDVTFKQYKPYGVRVVTLNTAGTNVTAEAEQKRTAKEEGGFWYTIVSGDRLWNLSKRFYGAGNRYMEIYNANVPVFEEAAKAHGRQSSSNGHWIWAGMKLWIPNGTYKAASSGTSSKKSTSTNSTVSTASTSVIPNPQFVETPHSNHDFYGYTPEEIERNYYSENGISVESVTARNASASSTPRLITSSPVVYKPNGNGVL